jgi:hypothetical protein
MRMGVWVEGIWIPWIPLLGWHSGHVRRIHGVRRWV